MASLRECDRCHRKMEPYRSRKRDENGDLLCEGCTNGREGRPLTGMKIAKKAEPGTVAKAPFARLEGIGIVRLAHDSSNSGIIFHCPFCFSSVTEYLTIEGMKTFGETVGTTQMVLTADENERTGGRWVEAHIHEFGEQPLMEVVVQRNQQTKSIFATPEHQWLVKSNRRIMPDDGIAPISRKGKPRDWRPTECKRGHDLEEFGRVKKNGTRDCTLCAEMSEPVDGISRATDREVATQDLQPGHRLSFLRQEGVGSLSPSHEGIRHGVVFGDGRRASRISSCVTLWGEKDKQLLQYFPDRRYSPQETPNGVKGIRVAGDLPASYKDLPAGTESREYLYGWLAGYFAADGTVGDQGNVVLNSARREHLEAVRDIALCLGISTYGITSKWRKGFPDREESELFQVEFVSSTLNEDFFLIEEHRSRYIARDYDYERFGWTVVSVTMTDRVETVYCAVVPDTHSFALADNIWVKNCGSGQCVARSDGTTECEFCHTCFIVQVQPTQPEMPQTINGVPYQIPGMPERSTTPPQDNPISNPDGSSQEPADYPDEDGASFGGDDLSDKVDLGDDVQKSAALITEEGYVLPADDYLAHLALRHTKDRKATLEEVRRMNQRER